MAPPNHSPHHPLGDTMHGLVVAVERVEKNQERFEQCLMGCMEDGEPGLLARVKNVETELREQRDAKKERERTVFAAVVAAVITGVGGAIMSAWAIVTGR